ncbi:hypothetical protein SCHPADRAFT_849577 [Schizopora paradoxa]|uniref:Uncharacterized protein n=1 Tax=Schizopora paradoxa TaxID=27342 RepID=A0A0H2SEA2_9AGAM|nr:hypothetical protein SCHPADRAFT_849577 [Schizopora paradoxa]
MGNCVTNWIFRRQKFCCCLPARLGAAVLSFLSILFGGLLMIIIWYEVATNYFMSNEEKVAFVLAGLLETILFVSSVLGFVGTLARKQSFVVTYAIILYFHFFVNLAVASYFLWMITHVADEDIVKLCEEGIRNDQAQGQCKGLLNVTKGLYWGVSLTVLAVEAYCTLIVTRYVNQLRYEKRGVRESRMLKRQSAFDAYQEHIMGGSSFNTPTSAGFKSPLGEAHSMDDLEGRGLLLAEPKEFDPYGSESCGTKPMSSSALDGTKTQAVNQDFKESSGVQSPSRLSAEEKPPRTPSPLREHYEDKL